MYFIEDAIEDLRKLPEKMKKAAQEILDGEVPRLIAEFKERSPVDTGLYQSSWQKAPLRIGFRTMAGVRIRNIDYQKAEWMEYGAAPGGPPWYFPGPRKPTGKLTESGGRIWAGGLDPGHSLTIGGAIDAVIFNNDLRQEKIAKAVADNVMRYI